jgi:hypothetical protein
MKTKTINNLEKLEKTLNINVNKDNKKYFEDFFKNRFLNISEDNKIMYPNKIYFKNKNKELKKKLDELNKFKKFWLKKNKDAKNYYRNIENTKYFKKNYWKHKIKKLTNENYAQDIKNTKLTEKTLMDPEYKNLLNTFLLDPDYRKKLTDTVNNSIIYKKQKIGDISKKKQEFKIELSNNNIKKLNKEIEDIKFKIKTNKIILKTIKGKL